MSAVPSSMVAAVACSAAAGKNPWVPLALIFLLAAPSSVPSLMIDPGLHRELHSLGPVELLWTLGFVFLALSIVDSLADKIGVIEKWWVPVSTTYRPFAGVAAAALVGVAAARHVAEPEPALVHADAFGYAAGSVLAATIALAVLTTWIATMGKTGGRLLLTMVPVPGLRLAHSFLDDFFAFAASIAGLAFGHTALVPVLLAIYVLVGLVTGPLLTRLTWIHVRIGLALIAKAWRSMRGGGTSLRAPKWIARWIAAQGWTDATTIEAYVFAAPALGRCRSGALVLAHGRAAFVTRVWFRARARVIDEASLARIGFAETATARLVTLVERLPSGALGELRAYLYPGIEEEVRGRVAAAASAAGLVAVRADSESARRALPGYADRERSVRFRPAAESGSLRLQGLLTIGLAIGVGIAAGGVFVPIGAGYLVSPFQRRFAFGLLLSGYLAVCVLATAGIGWPAAVIYASLANVLALRDLARQAIKARIDGYVDRRAWLPIVAQRVWVPAGSVLGPHDRATAGDDLWTDGPWRAVVRVLAEREARGSLDPTVVG